MTLADEDNHFMQINVIFRLLFRIVSAVIGGILIVVVVVALINLFFFTLNYFDVWQIRKQFIFPVRALFTFLIGVFIFWRRAPNIYNGLVNKFRKSQKFRYFILLSLFYIVCLLSYIQLFEPRPFTYGLEFLFEPYQYGRLANDVEQFLKLLLYPIFIFGFGLFLLGKAKVPTQNNYDKS